METNLSRYKGVKKMFEHYTRAAFHFVQGREIFFEGGVVLIIVSVVIWELLRDRGGKL